MAKREVIVINSKGLHARPAAMIAKIASTYDSKVSISRSDERADAKSVLSLLILAAGKGTHLLLEAEGGDAESALDELEELFLKRFGED